MTLASNKTDQDNNSLVKLIHLILLSGVVTTSLFLVLHFLSLSSVSVPTVAADSADCPGCRPAEASPAYLPLVSANSADYPNCRIGVGITRNPFITYNYTPTRSGWYVDWGVGSHPPTGVDYYFTVRVHQDKTSTYGAYLGTYQTTPSLTTTAGELGPIVQTNPGRVWLIGNEPDRPYSQDDVMPDMYAQIYHDAYWFIKGIDPTGKVANGAVVQPTPLRLQYLDMVLNAYRAKYGTSMPVDVWNVHLYIIPENYRAPGADIPPGITATSGMQYTPYDHLDINVFSGLMVSLRTWMKSHGYQNTPLIVTEYGALYPLWYLSGSFGLTQNDIDDYLHDAINYATNHSDPALGYPPDGYRLVQQAALYSLDDDSLFPSAPPDPTYFRWGSFLFRSTPPYTRTETGDAFVADVQTIQPRIDLLPYQSFTDPSALIVSSTEAVSPTLYVQVSNAGNVAMSNSAVVTFTDVTSGSNAFMGIAILPPLSGCGTSGLANVLWPNLAPGLHMMRVEVEAGVQLDGVLTSNGVLTATVLVGTHGVYLPTVQR